MDTHQTRNPSYPEFQSDLKCLMGVLQRVKGYIGVAEELRELYSNI